VDALGLPATLDLAVRSLARRGRHVQIGLLAADPVVPMRAVVANELTLLGTHGLSAGDYPELVALVSSGALRPQDVVERWIDLEDAPQAMAAMADNALPGVTMIAVDPGLAPAAGGSAPS
jgi:alcohol dehydrogenase